MKKLLKISWLGLFIILFTLACSSRPASTPVKQVTDKAPGSKETNAKSDSPKHSDQKKSDLDRSTADLFKARCEHQMAQYQCQECRYEVGVVKVSADLFNKGLIKMDTVKKRSKESTLALTGEIQLNPKQAIYMGSPVAGLLRKIRVDLGEAVKKGQVLFEIDSPKLAETRGEYLSALSALKYAKKSLDRQTVLSKANLSSEKEFLAAQYQYESAAIRVNNLSNRLIGMGLNVTDIGGPFGGRLIIKAPFDGKIIRIKSALGKWLTPGQEVLLLADMSTLWMWVDLYENQLPTVTAQLKKKEMRVTVAVKAYPDSIFTGRLDLVGLVMEEKTRTVKSRVSVNNPDFLLRPGMFGLMTLHFPVREKVMVVPVKAVVSDEGRDFVFVHREKDLYIRRPVIKGETYGEDVEIRKGVTLGQKIVVQGAFLLKSDILRSKMGAGCAD